ncbi:hypothetical protein ACJJTC_011145 [Scirpophaga incertulas]
MSSAQNESTANADSEMEEGEIVDDLDDLSDISSEEEFLLRERLQVLENYNNVLERKKAKDSFQDYGKQKLEDALSHDLSDISDTEDTFSMIPLKTRHKQGKSLTLSYKQFRGRKRRRNDLISFGKTKDHKKKSHRSKRKNLIKNINASSEESEDEYRNKRRKLANAVSVKGHKNDSSSLKARINKMLNINQIPQCVTTTNEKTKCDNILNSIALSVISSDNKAVKLNSEDSKTISKDNATLEQEISEFIDLCKDEEQKDNIDSTTLSHDCVDSGIDNGKMSNEIKNKLGDSDEDIELLRQHALKTKSKKMKSEDINVNKEVLETKPALSEDEDSDTAELRLICLKSAFLKKAIELKRKQKRQKRMSQTFQSLDNFSSNDFDPENNTDMESVDMDIGSDVDDKLKDVPNGNDNSVVTNNACLSAGKLPSIEEEFEEDEDLLRAKLLISLTKNLPNIIGGDFISSLQKDPNAQIPIVQAKQTNSPSNMPEQKPFIINIGESDSEGEHEATKNLTKMHMKLSEQADFQQKLDLFLKSTRMEVEKRTVPAVVQKPIQEVKSTPKFVAKAVKHLPKSEQIEYRSLVKRMAELEKIKQARQASVNSFKAPNQSKDTLKPRNVTIEAVTSDTLNNLEQQIALKNIAEESAKMLKLKEEGTKLTQKYKIVATELRNIATAITLNKKEQRSVNNKLNNIRLHHQTLLKRSPTKHSNNNSLSLGTSKTVPSLKLQKENNPAKDEYKNTQLLKAVKVKVVNDFNHDSVSNSKLSVQVDVTSNKKVIKMPHTPANDRIVDISGKKINLNVNVQEIVDSAKQYVEIGRQTIENDILNISNINNAERHRKELDDYRSPLEALQAETWVEDPNGFLCPFEVGGTCKDPDCKYLHPKIPTCQ